MNIPITSWYDILYTHNMAQKLKLSIKDLRPNVTKSAVSFTEEIFNEKLHLFVQRKLF